MMMSRGLNGAWFWGAAIVKKRGAFLLPAWERVGAVLLLVLAISHATNYTKDGAERQRLQELSLMRC